MNIHEMQAWLAVRGKKGVHQSQDLMGGVELDDAASTLSENEMKCAWMDEMASHIRHKKREKRQRLK